MSLLKANAVQLGQSLTASQNFTLYQPASPDGTVRLGNGNSGSVTDLITVGSTGNLTFTGTTETYTNSVTITAASTKTLTLNGGAGSNGLVLSSANLVGVGTASPDTHAQLTVNGITQSSSASYPAFQLYNSGLGTNPYFRIAYDSANNLVFNNVNTAYNSSTELMRLDSSGNLGLGVTPSGWDSGQKVIQISNSSFYGYSSGTVVTQNVYYNSGHKYIVSSLGAAYYQQYGGVHQWYNAPSGTAGNAISFTQAMTLDSSGNLLVGTTSQTNAEKFGVVQSGTSNGATVSNTSASFNQVNFDSWASRTTTNGTYFHFRGITNGVNKFYVQDGGQIYSTTATVTVISDQRLKENVRDLDTGLAEILALRPRRFDWKENQGDGSKDTPGFIAQEVEQVMPELVVPWRVTGAKDDDHKGLATGNLIPTLVKAIQELSAEIETLKQKVNA